MVEYAEGGFQHDWQVAYSKNNHDRHPSKREYFDVPVNYIPQGFIFSPKYREPIDLFESPSKVQLQSSLGVSPRMKRNRNSPSARFAVKARDPNVTLTTGLGDHMIFPHLDHPVPK